MQNTLQDYSNRAAEIKQNISSNISLLNLAPIETYLTEISVMSQYLEETMQLVKDTQYELLKKQKIKKKIIQDGYIADKLYTDNLLLDTNKFGETINKIIEVGTIQEIQEVPLYYVKSINQYAVNIGGLLLRGNIGNIYNSNLLAKNPLVQNLIYCKHRNKCQKILNGTICKYYHDPMDLYQLKISNIITATQFAEQCKPKNYMNTSWIYTEYPENPANLNMRHFGSRDTLREYMQLCKIENNLRTAIYRQNYMDQCIHDILVLYTLHLNGLCK